MVLQSLGSFKLIPTIITLVFLLVRVHQHVHLQSPSSIQLQATNSTHIRCIFVSIFVCFQSGSVLETLVTTAALEWTLFCVRIFVLLQSSNSLESLTTFLTNIWFLRGMDHFDVRLDVGSFLEFLVTEWAWVNRFRLVSSFVDCLLVSPSMSILCK